MANLPFSQVRHGDKLIFLSGQIGLRDGKLVSENIREQTVQAIANIKALLEKEGSSLKDVFDITAFLVDSADYQLFNEVYGRTLQEPYPTRTTVFVAGLPLGARVELKAIARMPEV